MRNEADWPACWPRFLHDPLLFSPYLFMAAFFLVRRVSAALLFALGCLMAFSSCATAPSPGRSRAVYRVVWTATRTSDHTPLTSFSLRLAAGGSAIVKTHAAPPTEDKPAFIRFSAHFNPTRTPGTLQLVTRVDLREAARNKKGKLKVTKRNIGALLPIRAGETQLTSLPSDPIHLEVRLERE